MYQWSINHVVYTNLIKCSQVGEWGNMTKIPSFFNVKFCFHHSGTLSIYLWVNSDLWWNGEGQISYSTHRLHDIEKNHVELWVCIRNGCESPPDLEVCVLFFLAAFVKHIQSVRFHTLGTVKTPQVFAVGIFKINAWVCLSWFSGFSVSRGNETELWEAQMFGSRGAPVNSLQRNAWLVQRNMEYSFIIKYNHMLKDWTSFYFHSQ